MECVMNKIDVRESPAVNSDTVISDSGKVRMGAVSPAFPPPVRGTPGNVSDKGDVRMGAFSPAFPPPRSR
jgi:hypothetical protein